MSVTIDSLDIQIKSSAGSAAKNIEKLADALGKLSSGSKISSVTKDLDDLGESLDKTNINLAATLSNIQNVLHGIQAAAQTISATMADAIEWDGIQFRFGRAFGEDAEEVLEYAEKLSDVLMINQQQFMQYSSMFGSLLSGFGMSQDKITDISVGLTELSYDIWAAYNDRYKTYEEAFEAVRSAITGEIEPIRNAGIALTEASMQEYLDSIGMAHVSIEKLTEAQKSEVRYAVMVNSAMSQGIVGTYAKEMNTAEGAVRTLTQQMKTLKQAFGSLFIPILQVAVPWITAFVEILTDAVYWVAALFGIDIQKISWGDATKGVSGLATGAEDANNALGSATEAAKKLKSYTMGFDELNVINPASDAAGGAGGAGAGDGWGSGLDLDSLWDESIFEQASQKVSEIKEKILEWKVPILVALGLLGTAGMISVLGTVISNIVNMTNLFRAFTGAVTGSKAAMSALSFISPKWANVASVLTGIPAALSGVVGGFKAAMTVAGSFVGGLTAGPILLIVGIITAIASIVIFLKRNWEEVTNAVKGFFETNIVPKLDSIKESWERMKSALADVLPPAVIEWFKNVGQKIGEFFVGMGELLASVSWLEVIGQLLEVIGGVLFSIISGALAGAFSAIVGVAEGLIETFASIVEVVSGVVEFFVALFTGGDIEKPILQIADGIVGIFIGLYNSTIGVVVDFVEGIIDWFVELWDELVGHSIVPDMIEAIIDWFLSLPGAILSKIEEFCKNVKDTFANLWTNIKSWWNTNVAPKFTLAYWKAKFDVIKQAIRAKLDEVKQSVSDKWASIKNWFTANIAPKFTLSFWLDKFKNLKEGFTQTIKNAVNAGIDLMNRFIGWINSSLSFSWKSFSIAGKEIVPAGSIQLFTIPTIPRLETGGFLEDGLFTMNHGEIAGKFSNGKSVVANNQQIVEGIAAGVYEAVVAAMNATNGRQDQNVNVYLDGKQIYASVKKTESERGRTLMGNQLGYVY